MAFNPIHNFRKYQKYWVAGLLFVTMITFVLCSGLGQGGLEERLLQLGRRLFGSQGKVAAVLSNSNVYAHDLDELKKHREIANDFMREATKISLQKAEEILNNIDSKLKKGEEKDEKKVGELKAYREQLQYVVNTMQTQLTSKNRFFGTSTKGDDLLDFMLWRDQANRLGINLVERDVKSLIEMNITHPIVEMNYYLKEKYKLAPFGVQEFWNHILAAQAMNKVRELHYEANYEATMDALKDEFRVQMVQFCLMGYKTGDLTRFEKDAVEYGYQIRFPLTPHQLWTTYRNDLTQFDVAILPVKVEDFLAKVPEPTKEQLEELFTKYKNQKYNPGSDTPGFIQPERAKIQFVTADPESSYYMDKAKMVTSLETIPPMYVDFGLPGFGTALRYAGGKPFMDSILQEGYEQAKVESIVKLSRGILDEIPYAQSPLSEPTFELALYSHRKPNPQSAASLVASIGVAAQQLSLGMSGFPGGVPGLLADGLSSYQVAAYFEHKGTVGLAIEEEIHRRVPVGMSLVLAAASPLAGDLLAMAAPYAAFGDQVQFLPFGAAQPEYLAKKEKQIAGEFAKEVMENVQKDLKTAQGKTKEFNSRLAKVKDKYKAGIQIFETKDFSDPFTVTKQPALKKLEDAFKDQKTLDWINLIEGRAGTEIKLSSDDFAKLFFDPTEHFSVASATPYVFQPWPPVVVPKNAVPLNEFGKEGDLEKGVKFSMWLLSDNRFLFWKTAKEEPKYPEKMSQVEDEVRKAWKFQEARKKAWEAARDIANGLYKEQQTTGKDYMPVLKDEATKLKVDLISLDKATRKIPVGIPGFQGKVVGVKYDQRQLEKGLIPYPRETMSKEVFSLFDLKKPLDYYNPAKKEGEAQAPGNDKDVDELNKKIFRESEPRQIQVLTNQPRSVYYVSVVNKVYPAELKDFLKAFAEAKGRGTFEANYFVTMSRSEAAIQFRDALLKQLRHQNLKVEDISSFQ